MGFNETVIDIGPERMQRHATLTVPFRAGNFSAAQASGTGYFNAFGSKKLLDLSGFYIY